MTAERLAEIREAMNRYGPANSWTGTTGRLAEMIFELLKEREQRENDGCDK